VKSAYADILGATIGDRRQLFSDATERISTSPNFIEKDFIVSAALDVLFGEESPEANKLVFKGGTSLSKGYHLIERFSEDIDLVIVRSELGFDGDSDPMNPDLSGKKREKLRRELSAEAGKHVQTQMRPILEDTFGPFGATIETEEGSDDQTLLIAYPTAFEQTDEYVRDKVKLEVGARSATLPATALDIRPYLAEGLDLDLTTTGVHTIAAERTFLDKVIIIHGRHCKFRDTGEIHNNANRESRHYYDLAKMADAIGPVALRDEHLLEDVIKHGSLAFPRGWMRYDEAAAGNLLISPPDEMLTAIKRDYEAMSGMIFGDVPNFDWLVSKIHQIDDQFRSTKQN
jgi:hypothetical protein